MSVTAGNALADDLPAGHDVVLLANIIHYFRPEQNVKLVGRVRAAVEPGARLLRHGVVGTPADVVEHCGRLSAAGVDTVYFQLYDAEDLDHVRLLGREVLPRAD